MPTLKEVLNQANPNTLPSILQLIKAGDVVRSIVTEIFAQVPNAAPTNQIANIYQIKLPDDAKCAKILRCFCRTATGAGGGTEFAVDLVPLSAKPASTHIGFDEAGNLGFLDSDIVTSVDVQYVPRKLDVLTIQLPVVPGTGVMAIPAPIAARLVMLLEATVNAGGVTGECVVVAPGAVPGTTHWANLSAAKAAVGFRIADAVTLATVKLGLMPGTDLNALLAADAGAYL
jgi:hypothetical protein